MFREGRQIQKNTNSIENSHCFFQRFFNEKRTKINKQTIKTACATKIDEKAILVVTFLAKDRFWLDFWTRNGTQKWLKLDPEIQDLGSIGPGGS